MLINIYSVYTFSSHRYSNHSWKRLACSAGLYRLFFLRHPREQRWGSTRDSTQRESSDEWISQRGAPVPVRRAQKRLVIPPTPKQESRPEMIKKIVAECMRLFLRTTEWKYESGRFWKTQLQFHTFKEILRADSGAVRAWAVGIRVNLLFCLTCTGVQRFYSNLL